LRIFAIDKLDYLEVSNCWQKAGNKVVEWANLKVEIKAIVYETNSKNGLLALY